MLTREETAHLFLQSRQSASTLRMELDSLLFNADVEWLTPDVQTALQKAQKASDTAFRRLQEC